MTISALLLTILHSQAIVSQLRDGGLIESTCRGTPNYLLCVSTLRADPCSAAADVAGLGLIMVDAVREKAEAALSALHELTQNKPELAEALDRCLRGYKAVVEADVPEAVAGLWKGVPKFAEFGMDDAALETEICERSFDAATAELISLLSGVNHELRDLALVATAIIRQLL